MHEKQIRLNFEKRFMQNIYSNDKELNEFLIRNFYIVNRNNPNWRDRFKKIFTKGYTTKRHTQHEVDRKVKLLEHLTVGEKKVAKARLTQLVEDNDISKYVPSQIAVLAGILVIVNMFLDSLNIGKIGAFFSVAIVSGYFVINRDIFKNRNYRRVGIYVNILLDDVLTFKKEESIEDNESKKVKNEKEIDLAIVELSKVDLEKSSS